MCFIAGVSIRVYLFPPLSVLHGDVVVFFIFYHFLFFSINFHHFLSFSFPLLGAQNLIFSGSQFRYINFWARLGRYPFGPSFLFFPTFFFFSVVHTSAASTRYVMGSRVVGAIRSQRRCSHKRARVRTCLTVNPKT